MSTHVLTLEQICKDSIDEQMAFEFNMQHHAIAAGEAHVKLYAVFRHLVNTLTLPQSLGDMLHELATLTMQAMNIDLCVILLKDQTSSMLRTYTCAPELTNKHVVIRPVKVDVTIWEQLRSFMLHGRLPGLPAHKVASLNPLLNVQYMTLLPIPLFAGNECIGLMNCYSSKIQHYDDEDQLMLTTIANQAALAIKHRRIIEEDVTAQRTLVKAFVDDLLSGKPEVESSVLRRASFLGFDVAHVYTVVLIELSEMDVLGLVTEAQEIVTFSREERFVHYESAIMQIKECIQASYPGSIVDERDNQLICLLCLDADTHLPHLSTWLNQLVGQIKTERHVHMFAGIGNLCQSISDYRRGYAEANEALELGQYLDQERCSALFNDLGVYRYIHKFVHTDTLRDQYQDSVTAIAEYDRRKKTNLLDTLEIYLECGGNIARTSNQLDVHRNTLLQRLERLQKLSSLDLEQLYHRLPLLVALKIYRLRRRTSATVSQE